MGRLFGELVPFRIGGETADAAELQGTVLAGQPWRGEGSCRLLDGRELWLESTVNPIVMSGRVVGSVSVSRDMTAQRRAAEDTRAAERALRVLSAVNRAVVRASDEPHLVHEVCQQLVSTGGYRLAWVGYAEEDAARSVRPIAAAGVDLAYVTAARLTWADEPRGQIPVGVAIRTGRPDIVRDAEDPRIGPWLDDARRRGYASIAVLPLLKAGRSFGALAVYASEPDAFAPQELNLLVEAAGDLAYGIIARRTRDAEVRAAAERDRLVAVVEQSPDGVVITDPDFRLVYANAAYASSVGRAPSELVGRGAVEVAAIDLDETDLADLVRTVTTGRKWLREVDRRNPDGTVGRNEADIRPTYDANGAITGWVGILRDVTEREQAHAELRASEARLRTAMDAMVDGVVVTSAVRDEGGRIVDFRIEYANPAISGMGRVASSEQIGHTLLELFPAHRTNGLFDAYVRVTETGVQFASPDFRYTDPDAANGPIDQILDQRAAKMGDGYVLSVRDVTDRERARGERDRLAAIVEESADCIVITAPDGRILYANPAFAAGIGQGLGDLTGQVLPLIMTERLGAGVVADIDTTIKAGRPWLSEVALSLPAGTLRQIQLSVTPRRDPDGAISSHVTVLRDVTPLREAETELIRLAAAVEHAADLVVVSDPNGIIEYVNPAFERLTGNSAADVVGRSKASVLRSYVHPPAFYAALDEAVARGEPWAGMITVRRRDGSLFEYEASISPILNSAGTLLGTVEVGRDRSAELEMEATLERLARERTMIANSLAELRAGPTPEATAEAICRQAVSAPGLTTATLLYFTLEGPAIPIGFVRADGVPVPLRPVPARRSEYLRERAEGGPWVEAWVHRPWHPYEQLFRDLGVQANAFAPVRHDGQLIGLLIVTSAEANAVSALTEFLPVLLEFSTVAGALVGPAIANLTEVGSIRHRIVKTIGEGRFHPVFQPIVDLRSREAVGYEALTRFDSGQRPDLCFADAWAVQLGPALELATLQAAVAAARGLPAGRWLSLNVSPRLLADPDRLRAVLGSSDRPIVIEITEHEIIEDYEAVRAAIRALGHDIRLAVDDAGAGIANFGHIVELRPNLVKLDIGLVRDVNADLARQAMVVGLRHFAAEAGCRLLAEGVETKAEADTLLGLGVDLGQGYLFGRAEPVEHPIAARKVSQKTSTRRPTLSGTPTDASELVASDDRAPFRQIRSLPRRDVA